MNIDKFNINMKRTPFPVSRKDLESSGLKIIRFTNTEIENRMGRKKNTKSCRSFPP